MKQRNYLGLGRLGWRREVNHGRLLGRVNDGSGVFDGLGRFRGLGGLGCLGGSIAFSFGRFGRFGWRAVSGSGVTGVVASAAVSSALIGEC